MEKHIITTNDAPAPIGPYNQAIQIGNLIFVSGQIPFDVSTNTLILDDIKAATAKVLDNVGAILKEAGIGFEHVVKSSIFLTDMNQFGEVNEVYGQYFTDKAPARECVQVAALPRGVHVEISVIAYKP